MILWPPLDYDDENHDELFMPTRRGNREERRARLETLMEDFRAKPKAPDNATLALRRASRAMKRAKAAVDRASRTGRRKTD